MPKKKLPASKKKRSLKKEASFSSGEVMTLLEQIHDGVSVIAEAQEETNRRLDSIESRLDSLEARVEKVEMRLDSLELRMEKMEMRMEKVEAGLSSLETRFTALEKRVRALEANFGVFGKRLDAVDVKLDRLRDDVSDVKHSLSGKTDAAEFKKLEKRVLRIERLVLGTARKRQLR